MRSRPLNFQLVSGLLLSLSFWHLPGIHAVTHWYAPPPHQGVLAVSPPPTVSFLCACHACTLCGKQIPHVKLVIEQQSILALSFRSSCFFSPLSRHPLSLHPLRISSPPVLFLEPFIHGHCLLASHTVSPKRLSAAVADLFTSSLFLFASLPMAHSARACACEYPYLSAHVRLAASRLRVVPPRPPRPVFLCT